MKYRTKTFSSSSFVVSLKLSELPCVCRTVRNSLLKNMMLFSNKQLDVISSLVTPALPFSVLVVAASGFKSGS